MQSLRNLYLLIAQFCVFAPASIIRVEDISGRTLEPPVSASLQQFEGYYVPTVDDEKWRNEDFGAGVIFGILSCGIIIAFLLGCQVIQIVPATDRAECEAPVVPAEGPFVSEGDTGAHEVDSLAYFWPRVRWLAAMLLLQSLSGIILSKFEYLVRQDSDLLFFLTMLIGLGGNAGGQSVVLTCRKIIRNQQITVREQFLTGIGIGVVLAPLSFLRGIVSKTDMGTCVTLAAATLIIASIATVVGTTLPKMLHFLKSDPGAASAMIQVIMDLVGMSVTCGLGAAILQAF